ncbi:MAG TPA: hypothetical protein VFR33_05435 [Candidatus Dormibacteraeota bacterium]|nr:hypothetical protein [Candidatus Dormibacteraeota bacterium]
MAECRSWDPAIQAGQMLGADEHRSERTQVPERGAQEATTQMARMGAAAPTGISGIYVRVNSN